MATTTLVLLVLTAPVWIPLGVITFIYAISITFALMLILADAVYNVARIAKFGILKLFRADVKWVDKSLLSEYEDEIIVDQTVNSETT